MEIDLKMGLELAALIITGVGIYWKLVLKINKNEVEIKSNEEEIASLKKNLSKHEEQTPICHKRFENIVLDIEKMKTEEVLTEKYQAQIVEKILSPVMDKMNSQLREYVDIKTGLISREIESIKADNMMFKQDIKEYIKELKEENSKAIDRIVHALEKK